MRPLLFSLVFLLAACGQGGARDQKGKGGPPAETLSRTVAAQIEEQLSGVENLTHFSSSSSSNGNLQVTATFEPGTNVDQAISEVNNRVELTKALGGGWK